MPISSSKLSTVIFKPVLPGHQRDGGVHDDTLHALSLIIGALYTMHTTSDIIVHNFV